MKYISVFLMMLLVAQYSWPGAPAVTTFWFAWYAFHPETAVYEGIR